MTKEQAYKKISELVERFSEQLPSYKKSDYNETLTRRDFIDPFFKALGWDVDNSSGNAEAYREVIHEDRVKVGSATKAPDYSFRLPGGKRLFFVEAKKPSVQVKDEILPAYQIRRYGWSAKLPISIITDFEEFSVYDCTKKPLPTDKASTARIKYLTYKDYLTEFDFIWDAFSKERVLKGSFDRFVSSDAHKKGTATVDREFLKSLDQWRTLIAVDICKNNQSLNEDEINFAVQQTIDRLIFLRIAEDRSVEPYGQLKESIAHGNYYKNLFGLFRQADDKYNSGLFDFKKDKISNQLIVDNKTIKAIINDLYYPQSPYAFAYISVEILGNAYEQFLGKQITIDKSHRAKIEEKPEVRKAGGVYYTPEYIVDYIVSNTIGKALKNKTPKEVSKVKILDPSCGSGSFLIGAYQFLLNWHKDWYHEHKSSLPKKESPLTPEGNLTTTEKKRILLNNIFGVDIDVNAVEVTKLSLLLKCMEGETSASIAHQLSFFNDRVLPTLDDNIKSGNSLVDTDFYDSVLDFGEDKKIKPFNWKRGFPDILKSGGFDFIIGNPPYVMLQMLEAREVFDYTSKKFNAAKYKIDTYQLFTEQAILLLKEGGMLGYITPNTFLKNIHSEPLRKLLLAKTKLTEIVLYNFSVFAAASVDTCVFLIEKGTAPKNHTVDVKTSSEPLSFIDAGKVKQSSFEKNNRTDFNLLISEDDADILKIIEKKSKPLGTYCKAYFGIQTFDRTEYVSKEKRNKNYEPVIDGWNIEPYVLHVPIEYVNYTPAAIKSGGNETVYRQDRICIRQIGATPIATFVPANIFTLNTIYNVYPIEGGKVNLHFLLGVINSKAVKFYWRKMNSDEKKSFPKIKKEGILSIPIPIHSKEKNEIHNQISRDVQNLLNKLEQLKGIKLQSEIDRSNEIIDHLKQKIEKQVFQLFDLNEDHINAIDSLLSK